MLPRQQRLTSKEFDAVFRQGRVLRHPLLQLRAWPRGDGKPITRAAFAAPKKIGNAVVRNRVRRRVRERYRLMAERFALDGCDLIWMLNAAAIEATTQQIDEALGQLAKRAAR